MSDATFLFGAWVVFCAFGGALWCIGRAFRRPFDMPLAYALTLTALGVAGHVRYSTSMPTVFEVGVSFVLYYLSALVVRFVWRLGVGIFRQLRREEEELIGVRR